MALSASLLRVPPCIFQNSELTGHVASYLALIPLPPNITQVYVQGRLVKDVDNTFPGDYLTDKVLGDPPVGHECQLSAYPQPELNNGMQADM